MDVGLVWRSRDLPNLVEYARDLPCCEKLNYTMCYYGNLQAVKWAVQNGAAHQLGQRLGLASTYPTEVAASVGHLHIIDWLYEYDAYPYTSLGLNIFNAALDHDQHEVLKWAIQRGYWASSGLYDKLCRGGIETVRFCVQQGVPFNRSDAMDEFLGRAYFDNTLLGTGVPSGIFYDWATELEELAIDVEYPYRL